MDGRYCNGRYANWFALKTAMPIFRKKNDWPQTTPGKEEVERRGKPKPRAQRTLSINKGMSLCSLCPLWQFFVF